MGKPLILALSVTGITNSLPKYEAKLYDVSLEELPAVEDQYMPAEPRSITKVAVRSPE